MIPSDILVPSIVSIILGLLTHLGAVLVSKSSNRNKLDIRSIDTLEKQLGQKEQEISELRQSLGDLRSLKYELEMSKTIMKKDMDILQKDLNDLRAESLKQKEEIHKLRLENELLKQKSAG